VSRGAPGGITPTRSIAADLDLTQTLTRLTIHLARDQNPVWTRDGQRLIFTSARAGAPNLYWQAADGTGPVERLSESTNNAQLANIVTPDGAEIILQVGCVRNSDLMRLMLSPLPRPPSAGLRAR
jgi:Tol biopolymer transport system component